MTAVEWILEQTMYIRSTKWPDIIEQALEMEKQQHGETWDAALIHVDKRGGVILRALVDFDEYWEKRNAPESEGIDQPGLPEGRN
jgi:hypothetical protein